MAMRRPAQDQRIAASQRARVETLPVPVRGWNTTDSYNAATYEDLMYAPILDNWMCVEGRLVMRPGYVNWATGLPSAAVESLMAYEAGTISELFAACDDAVYDVTASGAVGAAESGMTTLTNAQFQHTMYATTSGQYLVCVNGADGVRTYSGSAWATQAITGATAANFINVYPFKNRLWFVEKNTLKAWYLGTYSIAGAAASLNLGPLCTKGGNLVAIGSITMDGGNGPDDYIVFVTSNGQCVVYGGIDPSSSGTWSLVGVYSTDKPLGYRCLTKLGGDLAILTESGLVRLSDIMSGGEGSEGAAVTLSSVSRPVRPEFIKAANTARTNFGWQTMLYTKRGWVMSNIPTNVGTFKQFVYNPSMEAWFPFSSLNGYCWESFDNAAFFGGSGVVCKWDDGALSDNGSNIVSDIGFTPWNFNYPGLKQFSNAQPHYFTDGIVTPTLSMRVDYDDSLPTESIEASTAPTGSLWGDGGGGGDLWDEGIWAGGVQHYSRWQTITGHGLVGALRQQIATNTAEVSMASVDVAYVPGGII